MRASGVNALRASAANIALPGDFPPPPPPRAQRLAAPAHTHALSLSCSSSSDDDEEQAGALALPRPLDASFGPRSLSRDPEYAALLAKDRPDRVLSSDERALITRMSAPMRPLALRPATAAAGWAPGMAVVVEVAPVTAAEWGWGMDAEAEDGSDVAENGAAAEPPATHCPRRSSGSSGDGLPLGAGMGVVGAGRPSVTSANSAASSPRSPRSGDAAAAATPSMAAPLPGSAGAHGARVSADVPPPLPPPTSMALPPPRAPPPRPLTAAPRPLTAAARLNRTPGAPPRPPARVDPVVDSFLLRQEAFTRFYRERAEAREQLSTPQEQGGGFNAHSRRLLERTGGSPSLVERQAASALRTAHD